MNQLVLDHFAKSHAEYESRVKERQRQEAARIFANGRDLAEVVAMAIRENPYIFGAALQQLREGNQFVFAAHATAAVYQTALERVQ